MILGRLSYQTRTLATSKLKLLFYFSVWRTRLTWNKHAPESQPGRRRACVTKKNHVITQPTEKQNQSKCITPLNYLGL